MTRSTAFAAAVLAILIAAAPAFAGISGPVLVSGPSPFASCTVGGPGTNYPNAEVEPWVAVNPADSTNVVGVFQQDRWSNGGAHGLVTGVSHNGGGSWSETWAHLSACAGGTATNGGGYDRSSDPWVTFRSERDRIPDQHLDQRRRGYVGCPGGWVHERRRQLERADYAHSRRYPFQLQRQRVDHRRSHQRVVRLRSVGSGPQTGRKRRLQRAPFIRLPGRRLGLSDDERRNELGARSSRPSDERELVHDRKPDRRAPKTEAPAYDHSCVRPRSRCCETQPSPAGTP